MGGKIPKEERQGNPLSILALEESAGQEPGGG